MANAPVIKVGIVDDSARDRTHIATLLDQYQQDHPTHFLVRQFDDGAALLENYQADFDLLFLDIKMGGIDGMRTAKAIRRTDTKVAMVFVTNTAQYATSGYAVQAQSYLLKPVTQFAFETEMERFLSDFQQTARSAILVGAGTSLRRVAVSDIVYLESNRHRITVHTTDEEIGLSGTLKSFEDQLTDHAFFRANSGYLINLQHLTAIDGEDAVMSNGDYLKISRSRKKGLLEALTNHIGGKLT